MKSTIYLDYSATTPVDPQVAKLMMEHLTIDGTFGNPASRGHSYGWQAEHAVEKARQQVADLIGANSKEIVWTSGATEADNLAIKGVADTYCARGKHIITSSIEHKAVLDSCVHLEQHGFEVSYIQPMNDGRICPSDIQAAIRPDTILISIMHANNEIGVINDIESIGDIAHKHSILFHVDAVQSAGKVPIDLRHLKVDLMSLTAHKLYGPKGIGALYVRQREELELSAQIHGGGHERGKRSGTLAPHQIVGMGQAFEMARELMNEENQRILNLRTKLERALTAIDGIRINGDCVQRIPGNLNISIEGVDGEALLLTLNDLALSSGSACTSASLTPSYVLKQLGLSDSLAHASLRITLGRYTSERDIDQAIGSISRAVTLLRK